MTRAALLRFPALTLVAVACGSGPVDDGVYETSAGDRIRFDGAMITPEPDTADPIHCEGTTAEPATWAFRGAHVIGLCATVGWNVDAHECRPLVCDSELDCPPTSDFEPIACEDGVCVRSTEDWRDEDVVILCVAERPRFRECESLLGELAAISERIDPAIARHCPAGDGLCTPPIVCGP